jgi:putative DNA primase/helicase
MLYKGYIKTKGKVAGENFKGKTTFKTYDEVKSLNGFAGVLADDTILIDIDDSEQSEILMKIVEAYQMDCRVYQTTRGRHFLFKNHSVTRNRTHAALAVGLTADIKVGSRTSYEVIKIDGEERFIEWDIEEGGTYQELPKWLFPVRATVDFLNMDAGDGRNQALFNYILTLTANDFTVDETREAIRILNRFVFKEPLSDDELEVILRDEAFQKPVFYNGNTFLFDRFANYIMNQHHIIKINGQLHIYQDGIYCSDTNTISNVMRGYVPNIKKSQKSEVFDYMYDMAAEYSPADARYIAFRNGVLDIVTGQLQPFSTQLVITNKIPWDYVPGAYNELADNTLNKLACNDHVIRLLLEECIGYCFYRRNELGKAFILTGDKNNGKSTFLDCVNAILGEQNISALDLKELGDRFSTSMMFGKLANIGDDIGDDFLQGSQVSMFKKVVTGNRIKAERKGQDPFEFSPYIKLLFSANDIPRMKDKTGAVLRRLVIIPFNARFSKYLSDGSLDPNYDPYIKYKLIEQSSLEYMIRVGVEGLQRIIENKRFTSSEKVQKEIDEYEDFNNPVKGFFKECDEQYGEGYIFRESATDIYARYQVYCADNHLQPESNTVFGRSIRSLFNVESKQRKIGGRNVRMYVKVADSSER